MKCGAWLAAAGLLFVACEFLPEGLTEEVIGTIEGYSSGPGEPGGPPEGPVRQVVVQPGPGEAEDCHVHYSYQAGSGGPWSNHNNGKTGAFAVGTYDAGTVLRALIRFEIPDNVTSANFRSARMILTTMNWAAKDICEPFTINIHKVLRSWRAGNYYNPLYTTKGRNSAEIDGATGLERFWGDQDGSEDWHTAHVGMDDVDASREIRSSAVVPCQDQSEWVFDITGLLAEWLADPSSNHGMLLRSPVDQGVGGRNYTYPNFYSGDNEDVPGARPRLVIELQ